MKQEEILCAMLEIKYLKIFNRKVTTEIFGNGDLFPFEWYLITDNNIKMKILGEAIEKKIKIIQTNEYKKLER